mmetsp:Transcript_14264/g.36266  ORF Transcript_14264/g.36266 Transcript_14264/m.36266 type:complete len:86 (-) Transcript_14264:67-324(-)
MRLPTFEWATLGENQQHLRDANSNRKMNTGSRFKPVRGRKQGTADKWRYFESCAAAAHKLGSGLFASGILAAANGRCTHAHGWTF